MDAYELINKLLDSLNELINRNDLTDRTTNLSCELLETLKIIENCTSCKKNNIKEKDFDKFHKLINEIELEKERKKNLNDKLIEIDDKFKKIEKLITKCENEEMARLLYESKYNLNNIYYIRWIPFNEFGNIKYLAKGGFGEVKKAEWIGHYWIGKEMEVVLKRLYNSHDKISDILKEVNKKKV